MFRVLAGYGLALAAGAFALTWLQYEYLIHRFPVEIYIVLIALGFTALGVWAGRRLTRAPAPGPFVRNQAALKSLRITARELEVLELLVTGQTNKQIARALNKSPDTVKTQVASLLAKLDAPTRTSAILKARELRLIA